MKSRLIIINIMMALLVCSCNSERSEYFNNLTKDGEIVVNYIDHKGKKTKILWAIIDGKVDYFTTNSKEFTRNYYGSYDCRLTKFVKAGSFRMKFESPKNKSVFGSEDYYYEVELKFEPPKDKNQKEYFVDGTIYIKGYNTSGLEGKDNSVSYDASFEIYNYSVDKETPKREAVTTNPEDVINEMKDVLDEENSKKDTHKEEKLQDGKYCFQLDNLVNSGEFYYAEITIQNSAVIGNLIVEYEDGDGYSAKFIGTVENNLLKIKISYDNDGEGPYQEEWGINSNHLILKEPSITLTSIKCE